MLGKSAMRFVFFYHSLISDWNHGNAHFLRGIVRELLKMGHLVTVLEPRNGWSRSNLEKEQGAAALESFRSVFPDLDSETYDLESPDPDCFLENADVVIVHEWNTPELVAAVGKHRLKSRYILFFHDTHHRALTQPKEIGAYDLEGFDGVLVFGSAIKEIYLRRGWSNRVWVWHEAADTSVFYPRTHSCRKGDLVWVGNWGDDERSEELAEFLLEPIRRLRIKAELYGVRYPYDAVEAIKMAGADYRGWIPNHKVPALFSEFALTVHIPRRPYARALPGIPTIRVFEALACGIPLICSPWEDAEGLFNPGEDFLIARNGNEMTECIKRLLADNDFAAYLSQNGLKAVLNRHTCGHRVRELLSICELLLGVPPSD